MSGRDRILTALQKGVPDQVPTWELLINEPVLRALGGEKVRKMDLCDTYSWVAEDLELEGVTAMEEIGWEYLSEDVRRDAFIELNRSPNICLACRELFGTLW